MNLLKVKKSKLEGEISIPPSKSHTLRAIFFASLASGKSIIHNYLPSTDTKSMIDACLLLGAKILVFPERLEIEGVNGKIDCVEDVINAGNSGIVLRFCSAIGSLSSRFVVVTGDHSIRHQRPIKPLLDGLSQLGVFVETMRGDHLAPVIIRGPIKPGKVIMQGEDSQPISALLIAAAFASGPIEIEVKNPGEKPWIALTLDWFKRLNIPYNHTNFQKYQVFGNAHYEGFEYTVPGDFSTAAFPLCAALVTDSELTLKNLDMSDSQGDKELVHVLISMGAHIEIDDKKHTLKIRKGKSLQGKKVDINDFIDSLPVLSALACYVEGETQIVNAKIARQKECDRIHCAATELKKLGANIRETEDGLIIQKSSLKGGLVSSCYDHRMAMSLAVAGLGSESTTSITHVDCIKKTFPTFIRDFQAIGASMEEHV